VDGVSWRILLEDFKTAYQQWKEGEELRLPPKTASFQEWAEIEAEYAGSRELERERDYWQKTEAESRSLEGLGETGENGIGETTITLSAELTETLQREAMRAYRAEWNDILLTALVRTISAWKGQDGITVFLEGHGREPLHKPISIDRTVGWFTSTYPVNLKNEIDIETTLIETKELLRRVPNHGIGYGILRSGGEACLKGLEPELVFNYLGDFDAETVEGEELQVIGGSASLSAAPENGQREAISVNCNTQNGEMVLRISYDRGRIAEAEVIERFRGGFLAEMEALADLCRHAKENRTAADYGTVLRQDQINEIREACDDAEIEAINELTAMQEGMYFHHEVHRNDGSYFEQCAFHVKGEVRFESVKAAVNLLPQAHDVLRTFFLKLKSGEYRQVILKERQIECSYEKTGKALEELRQADIRRGFDLRKDSLLRLKVVETAEKEYVFIWSFHHIIMDGWCINIILEEFLRYYNALLHGKDERELRKEIRDRLAAQPGYGAFLRLDAKRDQEEALRYWKEALEDYENTAEIPALPKLWKSTGAAIKETELTLSEEQTALLQKRANEAEVTVNTVLETAWGIVLQQYNRTQDAVFGKVVSGRNVAIPGAENIVGLFINTIPCRVQTEAGESVEKLLQSVQNNANRAGEYDYAPLAEIQARSRMGRDLIQTLFVFENYYFDRSAVENGMDGAKIELLKTKEQTNYAITVSVSMQKQISLSILYDPQKYSAEKINEVLTHYALALEEIAKDPARPVEQVAMCTEAEREQILGVFNDTAAEYPKDKTVIKLFEEQVRKTPDNVAVVYKDRKLTYRELNARANQVARTLQGRGLRKGETAALLSERTTDFVIGMTGILKAGGVYLPIDSNYPEQRIKLLLEDSGAKALIVGGNPKLEEIGIPQLHISDEEVSLQSEADVRTEKTARDLAYIIYTSGTTGKPKGAMIEDISIVRLVKENNYLKLGEGTRILQTGSMAFDAATLEVWGALLNGGALYLTEEETLLKPEELEEEINANGITTMWMTSTLFNQMINLRESVFDSLKDLLIGGEKLSVEHVNRFLRRKNGVRLTNGYGPTENTTFTTTYRIETEQSEIPIGKPISGTKIYIRNGNMLCGIGIPGELCIAGDGVARGYLNRPELTAEKFIDNPFGEGKLYRSGDLARWLPDGNIEYLGRIDEQVKIRGYRIELGEIETCIRNIEGIKDCAVIVRTDANGEKALYAYVVGDKEISIPEIRDTLAQTLPDYMIPAYMTQIEKIPVTRNGKLDKRALPEIEGKSEREYIAPRN
ncbi:MAG: amino acid adenylation domain-containing protein, partial [Oscillospiraceae bacterium]|nr:amino acid adenylation domain-containing protein [Oscillospiraceae bacterium]